MKKMIVMLAAGAVAVAASADITAWNWTGGVVSPAMILIGAAISCPVGFIVGFLIQFAARAEAIAENRIMIIKIGLFSVIFGATGVVLAISNSTL